MKMPKSRKNFNSVCNTLAADYHSNLKSKLIGSSKDRLAHEAFRNRARNALNSRKILHHILQTERSTKVGNVSPSRRDGGLGPMSSIFLRTFRKVPRNKFLWKSEKKKKKRRKRKLRNCDISSLHARNSDETPVVNLTNTRSFASSSSFAIC